jgi:hypothetical protein
VCRSLSSFLLKSETKRWWNSWLPLRPEWFPQIEVAGSSGLMASGSVAAWKVAGLYHLFFLSFHLSFGLAFCLFLIFPLSAETKGTAWG